MPDPCTNAGAVSAFGTIEAASPSCGGGPRKIEEPNSPLRHNLTMGDSEQDHRPIAWHVPIKTVMPLSKPIDFVALRSEIDPRVAGAGAEVR
jgi:hypothetical protein